MCPPNAGRAPLQHRPIQTEFGSNVRLHTLIGHNAEDRWTDGNGQVTFGILPGAKGTGYGMCGRADDQGTAIMREVRATTQLLRRF
jgi:hypothetical protein